MTVETATYITDLNTANPGATDLKAEGDDHLRLIKTVLKNTFFTDATGNLGVGAAPPAWNLGNAISVGAAGGGSWQAQAGIFRMTCNTYFNGSNWLRTTAAEPSIYLQQAGAHIWFTDVTGTAASTYTPTERWRITSGGILNNTAAGQPAINVQRITSAQVLTLSTVNDSVFNSANTDQASNYSTSTGIFTAPVAGVYTFSAYVVVANSGATHTLNAVYFSKNNATTGAGSRFDMPLNSNSINTGTQVAVGGSVTVRMAASDTFRVKMDLGSGGAVTMGVGSYLSAYLQG